MTFLASVGQAQALDAREAGMQAAHQALNKLGTVSPTLCIIIVPHRYDPQQVITGVGSILSNVPMIGFSVSSGLTQDGVVSQAVIVAMLGGDSLLAETHWFPSYSQASAETATRITQLLGYELLSNSQRPAEHVLVFADGLNGNVDEFCEGLPEGLSVLGCLSSGDLQSANSFQIAGAQSGKGGMAAAFLRGDFKLGIGYGHGWHALGSHFKVTRSRGFWLRTLDGRPASETYSQLFGQTARDWAFPPLNYMSRIYPLGFEQEFGDELLVRAPLRVEADGSFRMNSGLRDGSDAYLMIGSSADCLAAAREATQRAVLALGDAKPVFALALVDVAWQILLQSRSGEEIRAIQDVLGKDVPVAGGYTLGQIVPPDETHTRAQFLNQNIVVVVFGEMKG
jgi:hypothetical protein